MAAATTAADERYTIISSDCHAGGSHAAYREYLDPKYHDDFDAWRVRHAAYHPATSQLDVVNMMTTYGLILMGTCLILGLFTPFASLCAASFLAMIYLSMPPWPGTPPNPKAEGHYWIVNKNLIELIACLLIASTASGHWFGLDALFFGARRRRRLARRFGLLDGADEAASSTKAKPSVHTV